MQQGGEEQVPPCNPSSETRLRRALAARGKDFSLEDAARLTRALLSLAAKNLLVPVESQNASSDEVGNVNPPAEDAPGIEPA